MKNDDSNLDIQENKKIPKDKIFLLVYFILEAALK
jgi:hypothetical protein